MFYIIGSGIQDFKRLDARVCLSIYSPGIISYLYIEM